MTEHEADTVRYFISPGGSGQMDGTPGQPFQSLEQALRAIEQVSGSEEQRAPERDARHLEIICLDPDGQTDIAGTCRYQFYIDARAADSGDGTEAAPWPDWTAAVGDLLRRLRDGKLALDGGQLLRLSRREVFTATPFERRKKRKETVARWIFFAMAWACVAPVLIILSYLVVKAWPALSWAFLTTNPQNFFTAGGIWSPLVGTFLLVLCSLLIAAPIGVLAGIYLNEYARENWLTRIINLAVVNLAGVPSIVHALFGVGAFVLFLGMGRSLVAASCTVAVMTLPVIITSTREALASVPMSFREACWNMGASRWQTIRTIVLPNSIAGILTGVILQVARAAGETAPILFTGAVLFVPVPESGWQSLVPFGPTDRFMALSYHLFALSTQIRGAPEPVLYGTAVVLIGLVLAVNAVSIALRIYLRRRKRW